MDLDIDLLRKRILIEISKNLDASSQPYLQTLIELLKLLPIIIEVED